jgi:hypothetical protein
MIDYLTFIDELKEVKQYKHCPMMIKAIDILIEKYTIRVKEFEEEYAPREVDKQGDNPIVFPVIPESS